MFTKGPWEILPAEDNKDYIRIRGTQWGKKYKIANVIDNKSHYKEGTKPYQMEHQETMDTARLIKKSPEMFELLQECIPSLCDPVTKIRVRKLLAEIRGE